LTGIRAWPGVHGGGARRLGVRGDEKEDEDEKEEK